MTITVLVVRPDGPSTLTRLSTQDLLPQLQQLVGGFIEGIGPSSWHAEVQPWHAYVNEDGITLGLPINEAAHDLACQLGWHGLDPLFGTAVFLGTDGEDEADVPEWLVKIAARLN